MNSTEMTDKIAEWFQNKPNKEWAHYVDWSELNAMIVEAMGEEKLTHYAEVVDAARPFEEAGRNGDMRLELVTDEEWSNFLEALAALDKDAAND